MPAAAPETPHKPTIFISYGRGDDRIGPDDGDANYYYDPARSFTKRLYEALKTAGLEVWWDRVSLPHRELSFLHDIRDAVNACDKLLLVVGPKGVASDYVRAEYEYALSVCKPVITILRDGDYPLIPASLKHQNTIDFRDLGHFDTKTAELLTDLSAPPAPLGALYNVRHELPEWYIRREEDLKDVANLLMQDGVKPVVVSSKHKTVTLHGMGGIGKSTLANALALDCNIRRFFPDGVFWLELGHEPSLATRMGDIGAAFGDLRAEYPDDQRAASRLSQVLQDKAALIILDNVWDGAHAKPFKVVNGRCRLLITTRKPRLHTLLDGVEHELDTLTDEEALQLFARRLNLEVSSFSPEQSATLAAISVQLGGLALAVEIAASKIRERGLAFAPRYLDRLQTVANPFSDLQLDEDDKDHNVALSLSLSYVDLSEDLQRRFRALGVFAAEGTYNAEAVGAVWDDTDAYHVEDMLNELVQVSLVTRTELNGETRYFQHPLLRAYARGLLAETGEAAAVAARHFAYYAETHGDYDRNQDETRHPPIKTDLANVLAALDWGFAEGKSRAGDCVLSLIYFLNLHEPREIQRQLLDRALPLYEQIGDRLGLANTLKALGDLEIREAHYAEARQHYTAALSLFRAIPDRLGEANTLQALGDLEIREAHYAEARQHYTAALALFRAIPDRLGEATTLKALGDLEIREAHYAEARQHYTAALALFRAIPDRLGEATTLKALGELERMEDHYAEARQHYTTALALFRAIPNRLGEANTLQALGELERMEDHYAEARQHYTAALALFRAIPNRLGEANTLQALGDFERMEAHYAEARQHYTTALALFRAIPNRLGEANTLQALGDLERMEAHYAEARQHYTAALALYRAIPDQVGILNTLYSGFLLGKAEDNKAAACHQLGEAIALAERIPAFANHPVLQGWRLEYGKECGG